MPNNPNKISGGGGFGPVTDDGYGVSYIIASDELVFFHVASKHSSKATVGHLCTICPASLSFLFFRLNH
jgi:hypothetical protein